jgi:hypothetical protein
MSALGIRNKNPGNIVWTGSPLFDGELGPGEGGFARFDTAQNGIRAIGKNLEAYQDRHGCKTVDQFIRRWSATDQDVYVSNVARAVGVTPHDAIDIHDPVICRRMVLAIIQQENGEQPYPIDLVNVALGWLQPAAPIEDRSTQITSNSASQGGRVPFLPIMLSLLPSVLNLFAPRAQAALQKVTQQPPDVVQGFVQSLFDKLGQLTGQTDPIQATAAITKDPAADKVADLQEHALDYLDKLAPVLDKIASYDQQAWTAEETSRDSAASRALKQQEAGPLWSNPTFIIALVVMVLVTVVVAAVLFKGGFSTDMQAFVIGAIVGSALTAVLGFYFGSSRSSSAKDVLIGEMARQSKGQ